MPLGSNPIYRELAGRHDLPLYPFLLDGVIGDNTKMLPDGIHPNGDGVAAIVGRTMPLIAGYLDRRVGREDAALANE